MADIRTNLTVAEAVKKIAQASRDECLVLFIGAGVSRYAGYPDWRTLLTPAVQELGGWEELEGQTLPQVAQTYVNHHRDRAPLRKLLRDQLALKKAPSAVHNALPALMSRMIVTTNYDTLLQKTFADARLVASPGAASELGRGELGIVHLHGHLDHLESNHDGLIITSEDYDNVAILKAPFFERLRARWQDSFILFLGYGAGDLDVASAGKSVRAMYGEQFAKRHLALDLSGKSEAQLQTYWEPFCADVVQAKELNEKDPGAKLLEFLQYIAAELTTGATPIKGPMLDTTIDLNTENKLNASPISNPIKGLSANAQALHKILFQSNHRAWLGLQRHHVYFFLKQHYVDEYQLTWIDNSEDFLRFFTDPVAKGNDILWALLAGLKLNSKENPSVTLELDVLIVLEALCSLAIEKWVEEDAERVRVLTKEKSSLSPEIGILDSKRMLNVSLDTKWAVFLIAAGIFKIKAQFDQHLAHPKTFITPIMPCDLTPGGERKYVLKELHTAIAHTAPFSEDQQHVKRMCKLAKIDFGSDVLVGFKLDPKRPLNTSNIHKELVDNYGLNIVLFGQDERLLDECNDFASSFISLITQLRDLLYGSGKSQIS